MSARLIVEIIQTAIEEAAIAAVGLLGFPKIGVYIPLPALAVIMLAWLAYSVFGYMKGTKALSRRPMGDMTGAKGVVVRVLDPKGEVMVKVDGELWTAVSSQQVEVGARITVLSQKGLRLTVRPRESSGSASPAVDHGHHDKRDAGNGQSNAEDLQRPHRVTDKRG